MKVRFTIRKDNMFTFFNVEEIFDGRSNRDDTPIKEQAEELYRIFKLFEDNGYKPHIYIRGE